MTNLRRLSYHLTFEDAVCVWRMHRSGGIDSRIAVHFDVNQGRTSEMLTGKRHGGSERAACQVPSSDLDVVSEGMRA